MLLNLPKELLTYILSLVVVDIHRTFYAHSVDLSKGGAFDRCYKGSKMSQAMQRLALIHPLIRQILFDVTNIHFWPLDGYDDEYVRYWSFDRRFFTTLLRGTPAACSPRY